MKFLACIFAVAISACAQPFAAGLVTGGRHAKPWTDYAPLSAVTTMYSGTSVYHGEAASGVYVHVAMGNVSGNVLYFRSTDEGATWASPVDLGAGTTYLNQPVVGDGATVGICTVTTDQNITDWFGSRPVGGVSIRRSTDNGATWSSATAIGGAAKAFRVGMSISNSVWNVAWMDYRVGTNWDIYWNRSTDNGATWGTATRLVEGTDSQGVGAERPDLWHDGNYVHLVWMDARDNRGSTPFEGGTIPNGTEVYYKRSADGGATWGSDVRLTTSGFWSNGTTPLYSGRPTVIARNGTVIVTYDRRPDANGNEVAMLRSTDNGDTWASYVNLSNSTGAGDASHAAVRPGRLLGEFWMAWGDEKTGAELGYERVSYDGGKSWTSERVLSTPADAPPPSLIASGNYVHYFWTNISYNQLFHQRHKISTP